MIDKMVYTIRPQRLMIIGYVAIIIFWQMITDFFGISILTILSTLLLAIILGSFRFKFIIYDEKLVHQILLFNKSIVNKNILPNQIISMKLLRVGWAKKGAVIKTKKGFNLRLAVLEPLTGYQQLVGFANHHRITIIKTKDYHTLEKMDESSSR
ncbi:hypothetical protein [Ornithinibacillus xuwenensis]|uniref:PH domain-containing protein n=1 Tax=Ornithinibacillus xuwenensis TaxID=3144668 RepID=A0ABU9XDH2_9BACI